MVEFALVFVVLIGVLYGIITFGLAFGVKAGANSAADDAARAALTAYNYDIAAGDSNATALAAADSAAASAVNRDLSWVSSTSCSASTPTSTTPIQCSPSTGSVSGGLTSFTETVSYDYAGAPLIPTLNLPPFNLAIPGNITSSTTVLLTSS